MSTTLKRLADLALTIGAVVGVGCLLVVVAGPLLGVSAQFVRSGSMEPDFGTGALVFAREASVSDLTEGDVVSIQTEGSRITHRIVEIHRDGDMATLTLQGDANRNPDTRTHTVSSADRVFLDVPWLGYPLGWLRAPLGMIILAGLAVVLLVRLLRGVWREREREARSGRQPDSDRRGRRTVRRGHCRLGGVPSDLGSLERRRGRLGRSLHRGGVTGRAGCAGRRCLHRRRL